MERQRATTIIGDISDRGYNRTLKKKFEKAESECSSRARCRTTLEDQLAFESERSSSAPRAGSLMKSLLAEEMSEKMESRKRSPSIVAKLMGLDRMPSQRGVNKESKRPSDRFNGKTASSGTRRHRQSCNSQPCRKIDKEKQVFKDIYEVRESLEGRSEGYTYQLRPNRRHKEHETAFTRQKYMDEKHMHHLHASPQSRHGNVRNLQVQNVLDYDINAMRCQAGGGASQQLDFCRYCQEGVRCHVSHRHAQVSETSVIFFSKGKEATSATPSKIVLLKPDLGRSHSNAKSLSSLSSFHELWSDVEMCKKKQMDARIREAELWGKKRLPINLDFSAHKLQECRVLAKEVTKQLKSTLGYRGYSADESSHDTSGNDSTYGSDRKSSSSRDARSSVNREGKKRLCERWKMTHRSAEITMDKGSTLGEMLSMPDMDSSSPSLDGEMAENGSFGRFDRNVRLEGPLTSSGISRQEGWKDGCRSLSLPSICDHIKHSESCIKHKVRDSEWFLIHEDGAGQGRKKATYRDLSWKEGSSSGNRRLRDRKHRSPYRMGEEMVIDERKKLAGGSAKKSVLKEKDSSQLKTVILETPTCLLDTMLNLDSMMEMEHEKIDASLNSHDDFLPEAEMPNELQGKDRSKSSGVHESTPEEQSRPLENDGFPCLPNPLAQPESPVSSKEAEQPSPVSVLQAPFSDDLSPGSECFERVSTEIHGLRMQLQLLKLESDAYGEGERSLLISSDGEEGSAGFAEAAKWPTVSQAPAWEASYTSDMLAELGLQDTDLILLMNTWNSSEYPVDSWIFEKLEKKYMDQVTDSSRPDRRLLFDRIKSGITEIAQRYMNPHPWVKTRPGITTGPRLRNAWFEAELRKLLADQAKVEKGKEGVLQSDEQWMDLGTYIDGIGRELGKMVLDELISECLTM